MVAVVKAPDTRPIRPNPMYLTAALFAFVLAFIFFTPDALDKAAFLLTLTISPAYMGFALTMAQGQLKDEDRRFNPNIALIFSYGLLMLFVMVVVVQPWRFTDMIIEGALVAVASAAVSVIGAFLKEGKD